MEIIEQIEGEIRVAKIKSEAILINNLDDATQLLGDFYYQGFDKIILEEQNICHDFFDLKTKLAGEILQKFSNFKMKLVIVGDWQKYESKSLQDFTFESNKGTLINFVEKK
ncbi:MAG: DUF4180 domain-containing protein [Cytophagaceae bacterium]|nr:DUF4180 domain-containing protein [Cytophagaceae bacterium]MBL0301623.1 DUF4180 domain-containing protein [Cytophagaceae bacterium]MBL0324448.1 DUF4180 domain-containing protein [Cytophagaceae bacterium]